MTPLSFSRKKSLASILVVTLTLASPFPSLTMQDAHMQQAMAQNPSIVLIGTLFELASKVGQAIHFIAIQIKQNNVKGVREHLKSNKLLLELKQILEAMTTDQLLLQVDPVQQAHIIGSYAHIISDLIDHIRWVLNKKFDFKNAQEKKRSNFDIVGSMQRAASIPLSDLPAILDALEKKVEAFEKKAHEISLSHLNKFTRKINKAIVDPWNRWNMTEMTKYTLVGGMFSVALAYKIGTLTLNSKGKQYLDDLDDHLDYTLSSDKEISMQEEVEAYYSANNIDFDTDQDIITNEGGFNSKYTFAWLYNYNDNSFTEPFLKRCNALERKCLQILEKLGVPGSLTDSQWKIKPEYIGVLGTLDQALTSTLSHAWPAITLLGGYGINYAREKFTGSGYPWLSKRMEFIWNQMLGGAHKDVDVGHTFNVIPDVTLDDIIGMEEVKDLFKLIIEFVLDAEKFHTTGSIPPTRLLLSGPTRTGKTFIVEGLAGSLAQAFTKAGRSRDDLKYWPIPGIAVKKYGIQYILEEAKKQAPIVLFIDEVDLLDLQRGANTDLLGDFLIGMGGNSLYQDPRKPVILIVATNRPETLDPALVQPGRLGKEIRFEYPPFRFRKTFLRREFEKMALDVRLFDIDALAAKTDELSFEQLRAILRGGMIRAWSRKVPLSQVILEESLDTEIRGIITANRKELPEHEKQILSAHFAGQAFAYILCDTGKDLDKITLKAIQVKLETKQTWETFSNEDGKGKDNKKIIFGQIFTSSMGDSVGFTTREQVINKIKVLVAGFMAEKLLVGSCGMSCHPEFEEKAYELARSLFIGGLPIDMLSKDRRNRLLDNAHDLLEQCKREILEELLDNREILELIAEQLKEKEGLTGQEVHAIIDEYNNPTVVESSDETVEQEITDESSIENIAEEIEAIA